jgi:hypothetical protein
MNERVVYDGQSNITSAPALEGIVSGISSHYRVELHKQPNNHSLFVVCVQRSYIVCGCVRRVWESHIASVLLCVQCIGNVAHSMRLCCVG